jgi:hypothetical protein
MTELDLRHLHDWTLLRIEIDWEQAEAKFDLLGPTGERKLLARGLRRISLAREEPWGSSVSINAVKVVRDDPSGLASVEMEMQTGDLIEFVCTHFTG